jgi:hypothetical protein
MRIPRLSVLPLILAGTFFTAAIVTIAWRLAGRAPTTFTSSLTLPPTLGPQDPAFCGPLKMPLAPPPFESPFGHHLYADRPSGRLQRLGVAEIINRLSKETQAPQTPDEQVAADESALEDVATVVLLLEEYRRAFGAMPMGELNEEIVRRLQGANSKGIAVLPLNHPNISSAGELVDRWGTPYRFHPESAWLTTVRSAGPDREMWTHDDILSDESQVDGLTASF